MFAKTSCPRTDDPLPATPSRSAMCVACLGSVPPASPLLETPLGNGSTGIAFSSRTELRAAVDAYMLDRSSTLQYGFPIGNWDVSQIRDLSSLFSTVRNPDMVTFNSDLSNWNVASATDTSSMFEGAIAFTDTTNGLANWNMASVRAMDRMFAYSGFAGDVSRWDVSRVTSFDSMFNYAFDFRGDVSNWNVSSGTAFGWMVRFLLGFGAYCCFFSIFVLFSYPLFDDSVPWCRPIQFGCFEMVDWLRQRLDAYVSSNSMAIASTSNIIFVSDKNIIAWFMHSFIFRFAGARLFNTNLCSWSSIVVVSNQEVDTRGMFAATSCPSTLDPSIVGSWCAQC
jgi:Mycoplasma protein of unknown function, DUF285